MKWTCLKSSKNESSSIANKHRCVIPTAAVSTFSLCRLRPLDPKSILRFETSRFFHNFHFDFTIHSRSLFILTTEHLKCWIYRWLIFSTWSRHVKYNRRPTRFELSCGRVSCLKHWDKKWMEEWDSNRYELRQCREFFAYQKGGY